MNKLEASIRRELIYLLEVYPETLYFIEELSKTGELLFFGGVVRDVYLNNGTKEYPRDFDIAIKFNNKREFDLITNKYIFKRNRFGGYKFKISGVDFDVWDLNNTWAFKYTDLMPNEKNLAKSVYLNIDGVVYNFNTGALYADLLNEALYKSELDINLEINPHVELNLLRALIFKKKYKLKLSDKLRTVFHTYYEDINREFLVNSLLVIQKSHYNSIKISKEEIDKELQLI